jgi:hypothetical protein
MMFALVAVFNSSSAIDLIGCVSLHFAFTIVVQRFCISLLCTSIPCTLNLSVLWFEILL